MEQFLEHNQNPVLRVKKDGIVLYSNETSRPLLHEWGTKVGEKLPSSIVDIVQKVITQNSPEKMEVKAGIRIYLIVFHPLPEQECVNISGFDISEQKELEGKLRESENKYRNIVETSVEGIWIFNSVSETTYVNEKMAEMLGYNPEEMIGRFIWDFAYEEDKGVFQIKLANRKQGIDEIYKLKLIHKDGFPVWFSVSAKGFFDDAGKFEGSVGMFTDITEGKKVEEALRESKARIESIFRSSPVGIGVVVDRMITEANERLCEMTGYSREELLGKSALTLYPTVEEYEHVARVKYSMIQENGTGHVETHWQRKDGSVIDILLSSSPLVLGDLSGEITFTALDITERKKAEEEIQGTKNMLQLVMNNIPQGIFWKDHNSRYMGCNKVFAKVTGIESPENIVGKTDYDLPWSPEQIEWFREYDHRIMENDTPAYQIVESMREADGELAWVETNKVPLHDAKGNVIGILGTYEDITERKKAEEAVKLSNLYNRSLIEVSLDPLVTIGHDGKITDVNSATEEVTGYSRDDLIGTDFSDYFIEPEKARAGYQQVFKDGEVRDYLLEIKHKDGHITPVLYHASVYRDENGKVIGVFAAARDITERKKAEEALKRAHESLEEKVKERTSELEEAYNTLNESEKGLAEAQKMAHIGNWEWDIATDKAHWSEEMYRIFKRDPQKLAPSLKEYYDYIHPDDLDYYCKVNDYTRKVPTFGLDFRIVLANGEERTLHIKSDFIFSDENIPIRVKGIVQDITEQKRAEEKLQTLANAVESSSDAIITLSLDGIITSWNKAAEQVYGYSAQEVIGKSVSILAPSHLREETKKLTETVIQGEKVHQYETLRLRKDDTIINVSITFSPVFDNTGKLVAISAIVRDVTERIKAEKALRDSEAHLRQFYESDMFGMFYFNLDGSITDANDKLLKIVGYTREDLQDGKVSWDKMTPSEYKALDERAIAELKTFGVREPKEKEYIRKDGTHVPVIVGVATFDQVRNEGIAFVLDITEKKKAEEALANLEIARKKEIHHRIKNNLQVISSLLDLQADKFDSPRVIEAFRESQNRVISMALIHEELYKGKGTDTLDFSAYLRKLAENLFQTYSLKSKNIHLSMDLKEDAFFDMDTAVPLGIIVNEIISNSLKHAFQGRDEGEIQIKLCREEGECKRESNKSASFALTVSDNGVGIPENLDIEDLDSLGIQLITTLVDQLDGELELKRNNGTEFTIKFTA